MADEFKKGDVVQLKAGGPKMTVLIVRTFTGTTQVDCEWLVDDKPQRSSYPPEALAKAL